MRVILAGASGFLGQHVLAQFAVLRDIEIIPVSRKLISGWYKVSDYSESPDGDILIYMAEESDQQKVALLGDDYKNSIIETAKKIVKKKYNRIIYISSGAVYGDKGFHGFKTSDKTIAINNYQAVKIAFESVISSHPGGVIVRVSNVYGSGMSEETVLSEIIRQLRISNAVKLRSFVPIRDYVSVVDVASAIVKMTLRQDPLNKIYNVGTGIGTSVATLVNMLSEIAGNKPILIGSDGSGEADSINILDISATIKDIGWRPKILLADGLKSLLLGE